MASIFGKKNEVNSDPTRIILSFAMANHGSSFAHWIRNKLMQHYGLYGTKSVYLDSVVCRDDSRALHGSGVLTKVRAAITRAPLVVVEPEGSKNQTESGMRPIGCMRGDWNDMYKAAMMEAVVALIVFTNEYEASPWCMKELGQFGENNTIRLAQNKNPLRGVILDLTDIPVPAPVTQFSVTRLRLQKTFGQSAGGAWDVGDYTLDPTEFRLVTQAIGVLS